MVETSQTVIDVLEGHLRGAQCQSRRRCSSPLTPSAAGPVELGERASAQRLSDDYPQLVGAFLNEPYPSEEANCEFVDPHEWHPRMSRMSAAAQSPPQLASLIAAVKGLAPGQRNYLQRQLIVATRAGIAAGGDSAKSSCCTTRLR